MNVLVYAPGQKNIIPPAKQLTSAAYTLHFEKYDTTKRFDDFDGVILFQGTFEDVKKSRSYSYVDGGSFIELNYDKDQLDRRSRELRLLFDKGGFACFVLCEPFYDGDGGEWRYTDLVKLYLTENYLYRHNFDTRQSPIIPRLSEFKSFIDRFGAAETWFDPIGGWKPRVIAPAGSNLVGIILGRQIFCVPAQLPIEVVGRIRESNPDTKEFFELLAEAVVSVFKKQVLELPDWVDAYRFAEERGAITQREKLNETLTALEEEIASFRRFKWILVVSGDELVDAVKHVLEVGFGFKVNVNEQYREDAAIVDDTGRPIVLIEVTGVNGGVERNKVGQADYHRERAELPATFPSILIVNTNIKKARSLDDKDQAVAPEQVKHAKKIDVLIVRTLDLLQLLALYQRGAIKQDQVLELLKTSTGWLRVTDEAWEILAE